MVTYWVILLLMIASDHLMEERNKLDAKIQLLQEERQLINEHLDNQANKQRDVSVLNIVKY